MFSLLQIILQWTGLALIILLTAPVSGGHINPAVSLVMASIGKIETSELIPYMLSQLLGGLVALEIYKRYTF